MLSLGSGPFSDSEFESQGPQLLGCWVVENLEMKYECLNTEALEADRLTGFARKFINQMLSATQDPKQSNKCYSVYIRKRDMNWHILCVDEELQLISLINGEDTSEQIFTFLEHAKDAYIYGMNETFGRVLKEIFQNYQLGIEEDDNGSAQVTTPTATESYLLRSGYMTKCGGRIKTWKRRYFELYTNGELHYWDTHNKRKKKGIFKTKTGLSISTFEPAPKSKVKGWGIAILDCSDRNWQFICNTQSDCNEWLELLTQLVTKTDLHSICKQVSKALDSLEHRWKSHFSRMHFNAKSADGMEEKCGDSHDLDRSIADLRSAIKVGRICEEKITHLKGSPLHNDLTSRCARVYENLDGALTKLLCIQTERTEQRRKRKEFKKKNRYKSHKKWNSDISSLNTIVLKNIILVKPPGRRWNRVYQAMMVCITKQLIKIELPNVVTSASSTAPVVWPLESIHSITEEFVKPKPDTTMRSKIIIRHKSSPETIKFGFADLDESAMWTTSLRAVHDMCHKPFPILKTPAKSADFVS